MALFVVLAVCQIGWGLLALGTIGRPLILGGALGNLIAIGGWLVAKSAGIGVVDGLEQAEPAQLADSLAALLATVAVACALAALAGARRGVAHAALGPALTSIVAVCICGAAAAGVTATPRHTHADGGAASSAHHGPSPATASKHPDAGEPRGARRRRSGAVDLGGVAGVTPRQQARAEALVSATRQRLPKFADVATAQAAGYVSIGDAPTGHEHYVRWSYINDDKRLDPAHAESLVYRVEGDDRKLVAAMYMLGEDATLDTVPDVGGRLTQWHVHDDLCFTDDDAAPVVAGITTPGGSCTPPLVKRARVPMLHVWIVPQECGPFAALEGIGGGQVPDGEQPRCHRVHAAH